MATHIRFDWAMKRLLRNKANFDVLEGFLSVLLNEDIKIKEILESESNKEEAEDKFNRVDILVKNSRDELVFIEVQNEREYDFFHRMNFGQAKLATGYLSSGDEYGKIKKVYSINIVYFDLGQGEDYVYKGLTEFRGLHAKDLLLLNEKQKELYSIKNVSDIFATYFLLKVNNFDDVAKDSLDEWIYFLKYSEIKDSFTAKGLKEAKEKLRSDNLTKAQKQAYEKFLHHNRISANEHNTARFDGISEGKRLAQEEYEPKLEAERQQREEAQKRETEERQQREEAQKREAEERQQREEAQKRETEAQQKIIELAKMLKSFDVPIEQIVTKTGLSKDAIEKL